MRRFIPTIDLVIFTALPAAVTLITVAAVFTPQEWPVVKVAMAIGIPLAFWIVSGILFLKHWLARPTFETLLGTTVWTNGIEEIDASEVYDAINFYAHHVGAVSKRLDHQTILSLLAQARVEFVESKARNGGKAGLQKGLSVRVVWGDGFGFNAFFHECHHMIDECLFKRVDYKHSNMEWWDLVTTIKSRWRTTGGRLP